MLLLTIVMGIVTTAIIAMFHGVRKTQGEADAVDANRNLVERFDKDARFANAITKPGPGVTAGTTYVEWRTGNLGAPQTCTQWRYVSATQQIQSRSWTEGSRSSTLTSWKTEIVGVTPLPATSIFSLPTPDPALNAASDPQKEQLTLAFQSTAGVQQRTSRATQLTVTAVNTTSAAVPANVCSDVTSPDVIRP